MGQKNVVIVGGGITGLTAAYYLQKDSQVKITVLEESGELGGKVNTVHQNGYTIERGADSFLARKKPGMRLMEELGLTGKLIYNQTGQAYVLVQGKLHKIPAGTYMGIPITEDALMDTDIISPDGKKRVLEEPSIPVGKGARDESLGLFLRRRFGDELVEHLLEPLLSGIYSSDIDHMSVMSTFPNLYELEQKYGSVLEGLRETMPANKSSTGEKPSQFVSLENGLQEIIHELVKAIGKESIQTEKKVRQIIQNDEGYIIRTVDGTEYKADAVLLAIPHQQVPPLFNRRDRLDPLQEIPMSSVANVALGFDVRAVKTHLDGTGFVVSRTSDFRITACTWTDRKWPHTTPDGKVLFRIYVGKPDDQDIVALSDKEIITVALNDLRKVMAIEGEPDCQVVSRWLNMMPQYTVGHGQNVSRVREALQNDFPGIVLAGSSYEGVGLPDCIASAERVVEEVLSFLATHN